MSADNWTICPRCAEKRAAELAAILDKVNAAYGVMPVDEFDAMRSSYEKAAAAPQPETFREDYEFYGASEGVLHISYSGHCGVCGLSPSFEHVLPFWPAPADDSGRRSDGRED